jgi:hypothetical protein
VGAFLVGVAGYLVPALVQRRGELPRAVVDRDRAVAESSGAVGELVRAGVGLADVVVELPCAVGGVRDARGERDSLVGKRRVAVRCPPPGSTSDGTRRRAGGRDGRYLGDPGFTPLLEFLHRRGVTVFVHCPSLLEVADPDHITLGSDFPFGPPVAIGLLNKEPPPVGGPPRGHRPRQRRGTVPPPQGVRIMWTR